jgi:hypothetical protein
VFFLSRAFVSLFTALAICRLAAPLCLLNCFGSGRSEPGLGGGSGVARPEVSKSDMVLEDKFAHVVHQILRDIGALIEGEEKNE